MEIINFLIRCIIRTWKALGLSPCALQAQQKCGTSTSCLVSEMRSRKMTISHKYSHINIYVRSYILNQWIDVFCDVLCLYVLYILYCWSKIVEFNTLVSRAMNSSIFRYVALSKGNKVDWIELNWIGPYDAPREMCDFCIGMASCYNTPHGVSWRHFYRSLLLNHLTNKR